MNTDKSNTVHEGKNVKRIREILGVKQESLASELGLNQQKISLLEQKETIEPDVLQEIADALKVPVEAIRNFSDEAANNFFNTFHDQSNFNYHCTFNPLEKYIEAMEANKQLYERLLQSEREKVEMLQRLLEERK
jgi:transcriptional regulator with XRE-family HTH domain